MTDSPVPGQPPRPMPPPPEVVGHSRAASYTRTTMVVAAGIAALAGLLGVAFFILIFSFQPTGNK